MDEGRRDLIKKLVWVTPVVLKFGTADAQELDKKSLKQGAACGESIIRYGATCGIRQGDACQIRGGYQCQPKRFGPSCSSENEPNIDPKINPNL